MSATKVEPRSARMKPRNVSDSNNIVTKVSGPAIAQPKLLPNLPGSAPRSASIENLVALNNLLLKSFEHAENDNLFPDNKVDTPNMQHCVEYEAPAHVAGGISVIELQAVADIGTSETLKLLPRSGARGKAKRRLYETGLQKAARVEKFKILQQLPNADADADAKKIEPDHTALYAAAYGDSIEVVRLLLNAGAEVNTKPGHHGTPLHAAASRGRVEIVRLLLDAGVQVNTECGAYHGSLQAADGGGKWDIVHPSLDIRALINAEPLQYNGVWGYSNSALGVAARGGHTNVMELLIMRGAEINGTNGVSPLWDAVCNSQLGAMQLLHKHGADIEKDSPLLAAGSANGPKAAEALLQLIRWGADVNQLHGPLGDTALRCAITQGSLEVIEVLLQQGADPNLTAKHYSPLRWSLVSRRDDVLAIIQTLVSHGATFEDEEVRAKALSLVARAPESAREGIRDILERLRTKVQEVDPPSDSGKP